jgi:hypothetical protein
VDLANLRPPLLVALDVGKGGIHLCPRCTKAPQVVEAI